MDYLNILSLVPKIALIVLLIVGSAILVEVFYLAKQRKKKEEEKVPKELKQAAEPLKFPQTGAKKKTNGRFFSRKSLLLLAVTLSLLISLVSTLILVKQRQDIRKEAQEPIILEEPILLPTPLPTVVPTVPIMTLTLTPPQTASPTGSLTKRKTPEIKVYKVINEKWTLLSAQELSLLKVKEEIKIAVQASEEFQGAQFKVNGETIEPSPTTIKNSSGEFYLDYIIPNNVTNFTLEVNLILEVK